MSLKNYLVAHYKMNDNAATSVVVDEVGNSNGTYKGPDGDLNTDVGASTGKINGALSFDGAENYIDCSAHSSLYSLDKMSVGFWFKRTGGDGAWRGLISCRREGSNTNWALIIKNDNKIEFSVGTIGVIVSNNAYTDSEWHFVVVTYNVSGTIYMYIDDVLQTATSTADITWNTDYDYGIGRMYDTTDNYYFTGLIDNIMIFNKELTSLDRNFLYNNGDGREDISVGGFELSRTGQRFQSFPEN